MRSEEAKEKKIENIEDLAFTYPGLPEDVRQFFRIYKVIWQRRLFRSSVSFCSNLYLQYVTLFRESRDTAFQNFSVLVPGVLQVLGIYSRNCGNNSQKKILHEFLKNFMDIFGRTVEEMSYRDWLNYLLSLAKTQV